MDVRPELSGSFPHRLASSLGWVLLAGVWVVAALPFAVVCGIVFDAGWFWIHLGWWPRYNHPDPGDPTLPSVLRATWPDVGATWAICCLIVATGLRFSRKSTPHRRIVLVWICGCVLWGAAALFGWLDPIGAVEWYFD